MSELKISRIGIAADHRGIEMKTTLTGFLRDQGYEVIDFGAHSAEPSDYPDVAFPLAEKVSSGELDRGILVCMSGTGMSICANKVSRVRAAICDNAEHARLSREHNDANVLIMGSAFVGLDQACEMTELWLNTAFEGGRHSKRVQKILDYERTKV